MRVAYSPLEAPFVPVSKGVYWVPKECQYAPHDAHVRAFELYALEPKLIEVKKIEVPTGSEYAELFEAYNRYLDRAYNQPRTFQERFGGGQ